MPTPCRVYCFKCGDDLFIKSRRMDDDGDILVEVEPCDTCLQVAREEAREEDEK